MVVLADRYIYTLMVRDMVRGARIEWLEPLYSMSIVPDAVFVLDTAPQNILERTLGSRGNLDYWESGMDLGIAREWYDSFMEYQRRTHEKFEELVPRHDLQLVDGNRSIQEIHEDLKSRIEGLLGASATV
jgi:dTMP kinase